MFWLFIKDNYLVAIKSNKKYEFLFANFNLNCDKIEKLLIINFLY